MATLTITTYKEDALRPPRMSLFVQLDKHRLNGATRVQWVWAPRVCFGWRRSRN